MPGWTPTYQMNKSTIIMPCNGTGPTDPESTKGWAYVDFDWSNWKGIRGADGWAKHKPMDCEELMIKQAQMTVDASPNTKVFVYRNMIKAVSGTMIATVTCVAQCVRIRFWCGCARGPF